jgi:hypothetical protein
MGANSGGLTRRDVIRTGVGAAVAGGLSLAGVPAPAAAAPGSRVVLVRRPEAVDAAGVVPPEALAAMLDEAVAALHGVGDPGKGWRRVVRPGDVVGVKTNRWRPLHTPEALEDAIVARLRAAGVAAADVAVDDQDVLRNPVFARATALVNTRPMRTHHWAGLGTCLKNYIMFAETPSAYHDNACETLGAVWTLPNVRGKTRLNVLVMLTPLFHGVGPHHFNRAYTWPYGALVVSADPVAADAVGAAIITAKRRDHFGEERPITPSPHHIAVADTRYGIGVSRLDRIDLVRLGERAGSLI